MTYRERQSIRAVIDAFFETGVVDEVIVVDNNAEVGTASEVSRTKARRVLEERQGYGFATRRGLAEATGDLLVLAEPDGTFLATDVLKLLAYSDFCDAVFGTRTHRELIWHDANMGMLLKFGNWAVAKLVSVLFRSAHLSDVGCTYKLLTREMAETVLPHLQIGGNQLGPELMLRVIAAGARYVEVPVNYLPRVGTSAVTGSLRKAAVLGLEMIGLIFKIRVRTLGKAKRSSPLLIGGDLNLDASGVVDSRDQATNFLHPYHFSRTEAVINLTSSSTAEPAGSPH